MAHQITRHDRIPPVITVQEEKCVNCHACIQVCPTKICNNGAKDIIELNAETCVGCGLCIRACSHEARIAVDDFDEAMSVLKWREPVVAIVAPSIAANFPGQYLRVNGWLKHLGVEAVFDVSFGAELTIKSYVEYIKAANPPLVIASPCPTIVEFIRIYQPSLLPYLAPIDSPMVHTIKMIRRYYPRYASHRMLVVSPCLEKRKEFSDVGLTHTYNVTYRSLEAYFHAEGVNLNNYEEADFENTAAERAVLFSNPGGLARTLLREIPELTGKIRKIESPLHVYPYLKSLQGLLARGMQPRVIDCLNCDHGCNGGTGTNNQSKNIEELEYYVELRNRDMQERYRKKGVLADARTRKQIHGILNQYWEPDLYSRKFYDRSSVNSIMQPDSKELQQIYFRMKKRREEDFLHCNACGYRTCEGMAVAIFNGLNKPENCHHFIRASLEEQHNELEEKTQRLKAFTEELEVSHVEISQSNVELQTTNRTLEREHQLKLDLNARLASSLKMLEKEHEQLQQKTTQIEDYVRQLQESNTKMEEAHSKMEAEQQEKLRLALIVSQRLHELELNNRHISEMAVTLSKMSGAQAEEITRLISEISSISGIIEGLNAIVEAISDVSGSIDLLALNASIVAAQAGDSGRAFAIVAQEVKHLAENSRREVQKIVPLASSINATVVDTSKNANVLFNHFRNIDVLIEQVSLATKQISASTNELTQEAQHLVEKEKSLNTFPEERPPRFGHPK